MSSRVIRFFDARSDALEEIIELGDKNSKTLGHLPRNAYSDYARKNGIVICKSGSEVAGYCLFRRQKRNQKIKIAQLCVNNEFRGQRIADQLLDFIKKEFRGHFRGIALNCRRDYVHATKVWKRNHFFPEEEKRSRSKDENYLLQWYHSFNQVDLFSNAIQSKIRALLDLNIIIKLREIEAGQKIDDQELKYLINDDVSTEVDYYYAKESLTEITRDDDSQRRVRTRRVLKSFKEILFKPNEFDVVFKRILELAPPKNDNDVSDRRQLTECITNNIPFFVTTDVRLKKSCKVIEDHFNITILLPSEFIIKFDQIQNSDSFLPRRIGGVQFELQKVGASSLDKVIDVFFDPKKEKKGDFKKRFQIYCSNPVTESKVVSSGTKLIGLFAYQVEGDVCRVDFLRVLNSSIKFILFNQLITEITRIAISRELRSIRISNNEIDSELESLLFESRFFKRHSYYQRICLGGIYEPSEVLSIAPIQEIINQEYRTAPIDNEQKYELERAIYPGKIRGLDIQNLIIPIKPFWASQLFDVYLSSYSLFGANEKLLWNRKNVYFRSVKPNIEKYPARILWYVSSSTDGKYGGRPKGIVGCSYLEGIHIDIPKSLFSQFRRVGIYDWSNIKDLAKNDLETLIKVIEFSDTEVFKKSISLAVIQQVLEKKHTFQSPLKISSEHFFDIYSRK